MCGLVPETIHIWLLNTTLLSFGSFFQKIPVVNDDLPARILSGRVQVKPNVKEFSGSSVVFADDSIINKVSISLIRL